MIEMDCGNRQCTSFIPEERGEDGLVHLAAHVAIMLDGIQAV